MAKKEHKSPEEPRGRYVEGIGRRKTAIARVRLREGGGDAVIRGKAISEYFVLPRLRETALAPLAALKLPNRFSLTVEIAGGGLRAQAEAVRHGLARALVRFDPELKKRLRGLGFLTRDPRMVERKKYGLKKARRAPQWAKR